MKKVEKDLWSLFFVLKARGYQQKALRTPADLNRTGALKNLLELGEAAAFAQNAVTEFCNRKRRFCAPCNFLNIKKIETNYI